MAKSGRVIGIVVALVLMSLSAVVFLAPPVSALSHTWTTDTDFNGAGATFTGTEVVGTGTAARVELLKDNTDWANKNPTAPPGLRDGPALAFSPATNVTVLFGGYNGTDKDETWEYDFGTNTWTKIVTNPHPPGRSYAGFSYDSALRIMVLYGGVNGSDPDTFLTDLWKYDVVAKTWSQAGGRGFGPMMLDTPLAYDSSASRHILFGMNYTTVAMQTWEYDAGANLFTNRFPSSQPGTRTGMSMAYSPARVRTVLMGGINPFPPPGTLLSDTWEYNYAGNSWTPIGGGGPSARTSHAMAYRTQSTSIYLFGGQSGAGVEQDTWSYSNLGAWSTVSTSTKPPARKSAGLAYDIAHDVVVLYGGVTGGSARLGDTWALGSAYRAAGKYASPVFDAGGAPIWGTLWWNKTPANQPASTFLRFQIATSSSSGGPWTYVGPGGSPTSYYTAVGTDIWSGHDGQRYLRFLGDFGSTNTQVTPSLEDLTINYDIPPLPPCIISTVPADLTFNVPQTQDIVITFSEAMNTASVEASLTWLIGPYGVTFSNGWSNGDTTLTLTHVQPLAENKPHRLLVGGTDVDGNALSATCPGGSPAAPNPFTFVTEKIYPTITNTNPAHTQSGVAWNAPIVVTFSEGMNTSTASWTLTPNNVVLTPSWSAGDTVLTLNHATDFTQCTPYTIQINATDKANLPLVPGSRPNPWDFLSFCDNPYIVSTSPTHLQPQVALNANVVITFSEAMMRTSLNFGFGPGVGGMSLTWSAGDTVLTMTHTSQFTGCTVYTVNITATDLQGKPLIPNPIDPSTVNPFKFVTICNNPYIVVTDPAHQETDVAQTQEVRIAFSETMDPNSLQYTSVPTLVEIGRTWDANVLVHLQFLVLNQCTRYTFTVTQARNTAGASLVPGPAQNPWYFDTICNAPYLTNTDPANGAALVPVDKVVVVDFNKAMDTATVVSTLNPPDVTFTHVWSNGNRTLTLTHGTNFVDCVQYTISIDGVSEDGNSMILGPGAPGKPNPWTFTTRCAGFYIATTNPPDTQQDVPQTASIVIEFSQPVDRPTFGLTLNPSVTQDAPVWSNGDTVATVSHTTMAFTECQTYTATVVARNLTGASLQTGIPGSAPNPWTFKVHCIPPQILSTNPVDQATGVAVAAPIVVTFSEAMNIGSVTWLVTPTVPVIVFTPGWSGGNTILTLSHTTPYAASTLYTVLIQGNDVSGTPLASGPVPNPWVFTTSTGFPQPRGLQVIRSPPNDVLLTWQSVTGASSYVIYSSLNRFAAWPWPQIGEVFAPATSFFASNHLSDGATHYYIVRAKDSTGTLSPNSTMGVKAHLAFAFSNARSNVYWMSIPYRSMYTSAKSITDELTSARIDVVGKWDAATQSSVLWYFLRGQWRGVNFVLNPGDGFYIGVRASFTWYVNGTDGSVAHPFTFYPPPSNNVNWISLPYTQSYARASDIVRDIEGGIGPGTNTKIVEIARWDPLTQSFVRFSYQAGGWTGIDFTLVVGEGLYLKVVSNFAWTPRLATPEVP